MTAENGTREVVSRPRRAGKSIDRPAMSARDAQARIRALIARPALMPDEVRDLARAAQVACFGIDDLRSSLSSFDGALANHIMEREHGR